MDMIKKVAELIGKKENFAVATIIKSMGSTPRTSGSVMIVKKDGSIFGTIGGGIVEANVITESIKLIKEEKCLLKDFILDKKMKDSLDMVCGGSLTVLIETYTPENDEDYIYLKNLYGKIAEIAESCDISYIVSKVEGNIVETFTTKKNVLSQDGRVSGGSVLPMGLIKALTDETLKRNDPFIHTEGFEQFIIEPLKKDDTLYIFGGGHVGLKLAQIADITGFKVVVTDDRDEFANRERFPYAEIRVKDHYEDSFKDLIIDKSSYIVILTRGHLHDQTVLEEALKKDAAYIGMIGSRRKRDQIYNNLMEKGIKEETLKKVYSPVGLEIGSETPAEIAVSIIAEIIKVRSER